MTRISRSLIVCLAVLLVTCTKAPETTDTASTQPAAQAEATPVPPPPQPQLCQKSVDQCSGVNQCAASPLTAAAATIPTGKRCTPLGEGGGDAQNYVDVFSWNLFLAMNWPANTATCEADTAKSIVDVRSGDGTYAVWQTYMPADKVFVNPGFEKPAAWCNGNGLSAGANRVLDQEAKAVSEARALGGDFLKISEPGKDVLQAKGGVVTDQSGRWLRYERLMNQIEYAYIVDGKWNMPLLEEMQENGQTISIPANSIELKSAWKVLTPAEQSSGKYFTTQALVCNNPEGERTPCDEKPVTMGLVGLHIVQQLTDGGPMFWATFEHNDNDTVFFNPASNSAKNTDLAKEPYTELDPNCKPVNLPTEIVRETPIPVTKDINTYYQALLGSSVFANYRLISTQWSTGVAVRGTPLDVANIVLETYVQKKSNDSGTGCFACHRNAKTRVAGQSSNHSFLFLEAKYATMPPRK